MYYLSVNAKDAQGQESNTPFDVKAKYLDT